MGSSDHMLPNPEVRAGPPMKQSEAATSGGENPQGCVTVGGWLTCPCCGLWQDLVEFHEILHDFYKALVGAEYLPGSPQVVK